MEKRPTILVTNDDGYLAKGLQTLASLMRQIGKVVVVSTEEVKSAQSHSMTINEPLRVRTLEKHDDFEMYVLNGCPVDCAKVGFQMLMNEYPDILVSGINHGSNASTNVIYSGTMAAVVEACMDGIPAVGFSVEDYSHDASFEHTEKYILDITRKVLREGLPKGVCLNVNFPKYSEGNPIKGVKVCRQAKARWKEIFDKRKDPHGREYFWIGGDFIIEDEGTDTDIYALKNNYASIVPTQYDWTAYDVMNELKKFEK
jgi:5'-nucleotidase